MHDVIITLGYGRQLTKRLFMAKKKKISTSPSSQVPKGESMETKLPQTPQASTSAMLTSSKVAEDKGKQEETSLSLTSVHLSKLTASQLEDLLTSVLEEQENRGFSQNRLPIFEKHTFSKKHNPKKGFSEPLLKHVGTSPTPNPRSSTLVDSDSDRYSSCSSDDLERDHDSYFYSPSGKTRRNLRKLSTRQRHRRNSSSSEEEYDDNARKSFLPSPPADYFNTNQLLESEAQLRVKLKLPRLKSSNVHSWRNWQKSFKSYLVSKDCESLLHLPSRKHAVRQAKQGHFKIQTYERMNNKFYHLVYGVMPPDLRDVMDLYPNDGVKAWRSLEQHQASQSQHRINFINKQIDTCSLREGQDPTELLAYLIRLYRELEYAGEIITDKQVQSKLLSKLTEDYDHFVEVYEDEPYHKKNIEALKIKLRKDFIRKAYRHPEKYHLNKKNKSSKFVPPKKKVGETTPKHKEALAVDKKKLPREEWLNTIQCYHCQEYGHFASDCRNEKKPRAVNSKSSANKAKKAKPEQDQATPGPLKKVTLACNKLKLFKDSSSKTVCSQRKKTVTLQLDCGADQHMFGDISLIKELLRVDNSPIEDARDIVTTTSSSEGTAEFIVDDSNNQSISICLTDVLYVPEFKKNLVSVGQLETKGVNVDTFHGYVILPDQTRIPLIKKHNLYYLNVTVKNDCSPVHSCNSAQSIITHARFGHPGQTKAKLIAEYYGEMCRCSHPNCTLCLKQKSHRLPFPKGKPERRAKQFLERVSGDMAEVTTVSIKGQKYASGFADHATRLLQVYPIHKKSECYKTFNAFQTEVGTPKCFRSDNEYIKKEFREKLKKAHIQQQFTCASTSQQNADIESRWSTLFQIARINLKQAGLPKLYWNYAVKYANFQLNAWPVVYTKNEENDTKVSFLSTPFEQAYGFKPRIEMFHAFGCKAYVHVLSAERTDSKLSSRSKEGIFLGLSKKTKGYKILFPIENKIILSRDVTFNEEDFSLSELLRGSKYCEENDYDYTPSGEEDEYGSEIDDIEEEGIDDIEIRSNPSGGAQNEEEEDIHKISGPHVNETLSSFTDTFQKDETEAFEDNEGSIIQNEYSPNELTEEDTDADDDTPSQPKERRYPTRNRRPPVEFWKSMQAQQESVDTVKSNASNSKLFIPDDYASALSCEDAEKWKQAMQEEISSLIRNNTWRIVKKPPQANVVSCKWVYRIKLGPSGDIERYKARLVARGFSQRHNEDYFETFSPVATHTSMRVFLAVLSTLQREIIKIDISTAYLESTLDERIYMQIPQGVEVEAREDHVLLLLKALYGLKQSARNWYFTISNWLLSQGFRLSEVDPCLFTRSEQDFLLIVVDDILASFKFKKDEAKFKRTLMTRFTVGTYELLNWHLGMNVKQDAEGISINQPIYTESIISSYNMSQANSNKYPAEKVWLDPKQPQERALSPNVPYRKLIGSLSYLPEMTRPDICFSTHQLSKFVQDPTDRHWIAAKHVIRYLIGSTQHGIVFPRKNELLLHGYSDADFANDKSRRSTSGYIFFIGSAPVSWKTQLQRIVTLSTFEAELVAVTEAAKEAIFLRKLLHDFKITSCKPIQIKMDNQAVITVAQNPKEHQRTKHLDVRIQKLREWIEAREISLTYVKTDDNTADLFTKPLVGSKFHTLKALCYSSPIPLKEE